MNWRSIHTNSANVLGITLLGVLYATIDKRWWSCGDNAADVQFIWTSGTLALVIGLLGAAFCSRLGREKQLKYFTELSLRIMLVYGLIMTAIMQSGAHFYTESFFKGHSRLAELDINTIPATILGMNPDFQSYLGYVLLGGLLLICFRNTQRLGTLVLGALFLNGVFAAYTFETCWLTKSSIYLSVVGYFMYNDITAYLSFFTKKNIVEEEPYHPLLAHSHIYNSLSMYKGILIVGLFFSTKGYIQERILNFRPTKQDENPIAGVWKVENVTFLASDVPEEKKKDIEGFKSITLERGRYGVLEIEDSTSHFEYIVNPKYNQLEFWNFTDYRTIDLKGKYTQISEDSLVYKGRNNKDSLMITFTLEPNKHAKKK